MKVNLSVLKVSLYCIALFADISVILSMFVSFLNFFADFLSFLEVVLNLLVYIFILNLHFNTSIKIFNNNMAHA